MSNYKPDYIVQYVLRNSSTHEMIELNSHFYMTFYDVVDFVNDHLALESSAWGIYGRIISGFEVFICAASTVVKL